MSEDQTPEQNQPEKSSVWTDIALGATLMGIGLGGAAVPLHQAQAHKPPTKSATPMNESKPQEPPAHKR